MNKNIFSFDSITYVEHDASTLATIASASAGYAEVGMYPDLPQATLEYTGTAVEEGDYLAFQLNVTDTTNYADVDFEVWINELLSEQGSIAKGQSHLFFSGQLPAGSSYRLVLKNPDGTVYGGYVTFCEIQDRSVDAVVGAKIVLDTNLQGTLSVSYEDLTAQFNGGSSVLTSASPSEVGWYYGSNNYLSFGNEPMQTGESITVDFNNEGLGQDGESNTVLLRVTWDGKVFYRFLHFTTANQGAQVNTFTTYDFPIYLNAHRDTDGGVGADSKLHLTDGGLDAVSYDFKVWSEDGSLYTEAGSSSSILYPSTGTFSANAFAARIDAHVTYQDKQGTQVATWPYHVGAYFGTAPIVNDSLETLFTDPVPSFTINDSESATGDYLFVDTTSYPGGDNSGYQIRYRWQLEASSEQEGGSYLDANYPGADAQSFHIEHTTQDYIWVVMEMTNPSNEVAYASKLLLLGSDPSSATLTIQQTGNLTYSFSATNTNVPVGDTTALVSWDFGDGSALETSDSTPTHVYGTPGTYTVTYKYTHGATNALVTVTQDVDVEVALTPVLEVTFHHDQVVLVDATDYGSNGPSGYEIRWSVDNESEVLLDYYDAAYPTVSPFHYTTLIFGTRVFKLQIINSAGFVVEAELSVDIPAVQVDMVIEGAGSPTVFTDTQLWVADNQGYGPYDHTTWTFGDGSTGLTVPFPGGVTDPNGEWTHDSHPGEANCHTYAAPGTYTITAAVYLQGDATPHLATFDYTVGVGKTDLDVVVTGDANAGTVTVTDNTATITPPAGVAMYNRNFFLFEADGTYIDSSFLNYGDATKAVTFNVSGTGPYYAVVSYYYTVGDGISDPEPQGYTPNALKRISLLQAAVPDFSSSVTGHAVTLQDATELPDGQSITSVKWDFGDGSAVSTQFSPTHTYSTSGTYAVTYSVCTDGSNANFVDVTHNVTAVDIPITAAFTADVTVRDVVFTDASTYPDGSSGATYLWDFGDGTVDSTARSPSHTYPNESASYTVTFSVTRNGVTVTSTGTVAIHVITPTVAQYVYNPSGLTATFTDTSVLDTADNVTVVSRQWDFGDGSTSTVANPTHVYDSAGTYTVVLTVTDSLGATPSVSKTITITAPIASGDTYAVKGFFAYGALSDNAVEEIATLGELSVRSQTFAKDRALFAATTSGTTATTANLSVFSSINASGVTVDVPVDYSEVLLSIGTWMYDQAVAGQFTASASNFLQAFLAEFSGQCKEVTTGVMLQQDTLYMPEWVSFVFSSESATASGLDTSESRVKLWFSDQAFKTQYDLYQIEFVTPFINLDDFYKSSTQVKDGIDAIELPALMERVQGVIGNDPPTVVKTIEFDYHDPNDVTYTIPTNWTFVIYGDAGNNIDAIKAALVDYILANSSHDRDEWSVIFPDIFTSTEFIITPMWDQYAVPNKTNENSVYSPTVNVQRALTLAQATGVGSQYTATHISNVLAVVPIPYKSLTMLVVGGPENRNGVDQMVEQWADYMAVPTSSIDFDRMQPNTQAWINFLYDLLKVAELMTDFSTVPVGMTRLKRTDSNNNKVLYVAKSFQNVQYLVVAKSWLTAYDAEHGGSPTPLSVSYAGPLNTDGSIQGPNNGGSQALNFAGNGGTAPYTFTIASSNANQSTINSATGKVVLQYPRAGTYNLVVQVTDSDDNLATISYSIVCPSV